MTTIQDLLTYADGSKANGRLAVFWRPFTIGNANVTGGELAYDIVEGAVSITLYPNAGALPSGSYYSAKYELENGAVYEEQWIVPNLPTVNLGQVRVSFPPTPSVLISPTQLTSMNAQPGMFLMWDGARWVPGYPSTFNLDPNWIGVNIGALGDDINVDGSPVSVGNYVTIHIPDAGATARGVVSTGAQTFAGAKTLKDVATISQSLIFAQHAIYAGTRGELVNVGAASAHALYFGGDIVAARVATTDRPRVQADRLVTGHLDIDTIADPPTAMMPGNATSPAKGTESILLPHDGVDWAGIGMGQNGSLWLRTGGVFFYLNQNGATCRELRMDPYQHPNSVGIEATRNDATMVIYSDSTSWGGYGVNTTPELWFRMGPDNAGAYYYFGAGGATFPSLAVGTLVVSGAVTLPPDSGLIPTFQVDGASIGTRPILNFVQGTNVSIQGVEDNTLNRVDIHLSAAGGGDSGGLVDPTSAKGDLIVRGAPKPAIPTALGVGGNGLVLTADSTAATGIRWASALPANDTSTQRLRISRAATLIAARQELNLIPGANVTLTVVDNPGSNRVDATVAVASMVTPLTPWTSDIDAAGFRLFSVGRIGIGIAAPLGELHVASTSTASSQRGILNGQYSDSVHGAHFGLLKARGTVASPAAVQVGDFLGAVTFDGYTSSGIVGGVVALQCPVTAVAAGAITADLSFVLGGVEGMRIAAAGNVGIGTATPGAQLEINGPLSATPGTGLLRFSGAGNALFGWRLDASNNLALDAVWAGWTPVLNVVRQTGYVGLGATSPSERLTVAGAIYIGFSPAPVFDTASRIWAESGFGTRYDGFQHRFDVGNARTEAMRINAAGSVGIGTAAPLFKLSVAGNIGVTIDAANLASNLGLAQLALCGLTDTRKALWLGFDTTANVGVIQPGLSGVSWNNLILNPQGGNVGVGGTPQFKFDVIGGRSTFTAASERYSIGFRYQAGGPVFWQGSDLNGDMIFSEAGGVERMRIKAGTGVRIGASSTTVQAGDLGVARDVSPNTGVVYFGNTQTQYIYFDGGSFQFTSHIQTPGNIQAAGSGYITGRLGVGTTGPVSRLHVYGAGQDGSAGHYWPGLNPDCELYVQDTGGSGGNGGAVVLGSIHGVFAAMKGFVTNGAGPMGEIIWYLRPTTTDTALFEKMRLSATGGFSIQGNVNVTGQYQVNGVPISTGIAGMMVQINGGTAAGPFTYLNFQQAAGMSITALIGGAGNNTMTVTFQNVSDMRLKRNVESLTGGLPLIARLRPITAEWNGLASTRAGERMVSIIAQELREVIPDAVAPFRAKLRPEDSEETELLAYDSMAITAHLILAVQQLERRLKVLEQRVN